MKILFTGASSFSGMWFVKALVEAGHEVVPVLKSPYQSYTGVRKSRIEELLKITHPIFEAPFGHSSFLETISTSAFWDLLCHHGADVTNYKSPDFNPITALANNAYNLKEVLQALNEQGCRKVILTGSVFEANEGSGSENLRAVSPYGLSKSLTWETFAFYTSVYQMKLGKFVTPNPFGPYEEERFTSYLARQWLSDKKPIINTPLYVRDNIPISLLAKTYVHFAANLSDLPGIVKYNPSFYAESQASFAERISSEMQHRLGVPCNYDLKNQNEFYEPLIRINTDQINPDHFEWKESLFWDQLADYYLKQLK